MKDGFVEDDPRVHRCSKFLRWKNKRSHVHECGIS